MNSKQTNAQNLHDYFIESIKNFWMVSLIPKKYIMPRRNFDISAGNVREITNDFVAFKYRKFYVIPAFIKIKFSDIEEVKRFVKRNKKITDMEVIELSKLKSDFRSKQAKTAATFKLLIFFGLIAIVSAISTGIALLI